MERAQIHFMMMRNYHYEDKIIKKIKPNNDQYPFSNPVWSLFTSSNLNIGGSIAP